MFEKLGSLIVTRKKFIFTLFIALILAAGAIGSSVFGKLDSGGYSDPKSDSAKVFEYLTDEFKVKDPAVVLVVETKNGIISPEASASATRLESQIKLEPGVESTLSFWSSVLSLQGFKVLFQCRISSQLTTAKINFCVRSVSFFRPTARIFGTARKKLTRQIEVESHTSQTPSKMCVVGERRVRKQARK